MINPRGRNLIFLLSQPRSGSTMLQSILARNSAVHTTSEPWIALAPCFAIREGSTAPYDAELGQQALVDFCDTLPNGRADYFDAVAAMLVSLYNKSLSMSDRGDGSEKMCFLDKTPRYYRIIPALEEMFPEAKFIFLARNPLSVLASILDTWGDVDGDVLTRFNDDLVLAPKMLTFAACNPEHIRVGYEDLVLHPEPVVAHLCRQLGLAYSAEMLNYQQASVRLNGRFGDNKVHYKTGPHANSVESWKTVLKGRKETAKKYLDLLGDPVIHSLGYSASTLRKELNEI